MEDDLDLLVVRCEDPEKIISCVDELYLRLNRETRDKLRHIRMTYVVEFGKKGLFERVANRSVRQILEHYDKSNVDLEKSGELDGVGFKLYAQRKEPTVDQ